MSDVQMLQMIANRLDRLDSKMDNMSDAITSLARVEERLTGHVTRLKQVHEQVDRLEQRAARLERWRWRSAGYASAVGLTIGLAVPFAVKMIVVTG